MTVGLGKYQNNEAISKLIAKRMTSTSCFSQNLTIRDFFLVNSFLYGICPTGYLFFLFNDFREEIKDYPCILELRLLRSAKALASRFS
jgi:hypothetical protein